MQPEDFYTTILARLDTIDNQLTGIATKTDLAKVTGELNEMKSVMVTKTDLAEIQSEMATKTELSELRKEMATKSDLEEVRSEMATKSDLVEMNIELTGIRSEMATKKEVTNLESRFIKKLDLFFLALDRDVMHDRQRIIRLEEHLHLPRLQT